MDINTVRGLSTILIMIAFAGVVWWAYGKKRKPRFEEAASLPFDDEALNQQSLHNQNNDHGEKQQ